MVKFEEIPNEKHLNCNVSKTNHEYAFHNNQFSNSHFKISDFPNPNDCESYSPKVKKVQRPNSEQEKIYNGHVLDEMATLDFYRLLGD